MAGIRPIQNVVPRMGGEFPDQRARPNARNRWYSSSQEYERHEEIYEAFDTLHEKKAWIHVFPEECRWDNYKPLRPFRKGAFIFAYKYQTPIIPMVISYRERTGLYKYFAKNKPLYTITIGEPMYPNMEMPRKESVDEMRDRVHAKMVEMAGITHNPWPSVQPNDKG